MILGFNDNIFFDFNTIKVCDSKAGGGKSTEASTAFRGYNIPDDEVAMCTSSNFLARAASAKFNRNVKTIASLIAENDYPRFFIAPKYPTAKHIIIDEPLLSDTKFIFNWALENKGNYNIIMLTDTHQLLTPDKNADPLGDYYAFIDNDCVEVSDLNRTFRPQTQATRDAYDRLYDFALCDNLLKPTEIGFNIPIIPFEAMPAFSMDNAYMGRTDEIDDYLYRYFNLSQVVPEEDRIPKGDIASSKTTKTTYGLASQYQAKKLKLRSYTQPTNVASPIRWQGSEIEANQKIYYIMHPDSLISFRELYTVVTRCKDINSLVIVLIDRGRVQHQELLNFNDKPVKHAGVYKVSHNTDTEYVLESEIEDIVKDTNDIRYERNFILRDTTYNGLPVIAYQGENKIVGMNKYYTVQDGQYVLHTDKPERTNVSSAWSLAKHETSWRFSFYPEIYKILEANGIKKLMPILVSGSDDHISNYDIDFTGAYPQILKYYDMPCNGILRSDTPQPDMINFYKYENKANEKWYNESTQKLITDGHIVTDELKEYLEASHRLDGTKIKFTYLFSVPKQHGSYPGNYLYAKYHQSKETKDTYKKAAKFGSWNKQYLKEYEDCYVVNEQCTYSLVYAHIVSLQTYLMLKLYDELTAQGLEPTYCLADSVHFKTLDLDRAVKAANNAFDTFLEWKIEDHDKNVFYRKGDELLSAKDRKNALRKARRAAAKAELEAVRLANKSKVC